MGTKPVTKAVAKTKKKGGGYTFLTALVAVAGLFIVVFAIANNPVSSNANNEPLTEEAYRVEFTRATSLLEESIIGLEQMEDEDFDLLWKQRFLNYLSSIKLSFEQLERLKPPSSYADIHHRVIVALHDCYVATGYLDKGVERLDVSTIETALALLDSCIQKFAEDGDLNAEIDRIRTTPWVSEPVTQLPTVTPQAALPSVTTRTEAIANNIANLRQGPGTDHAILGTTQIGQSLTIIGQNAAGDWYQLDNGMWIAAFLVDNAPSGLPTVME